LKKLFLLGDESGLCERLDAGLDVNSDIDGEPLLKVALMTAVTAEHWYENEELAVLLRTKFPTVAQYRDALKRIAVDLLNRGADVNRPAGAHSILAVAEALNDDIISSLCRERANSANDQDSGPFLLAAERGDVESLTALLAKGARLNKRHFLHGTTPLMLACQGPGGEDAPPLSGNQLASQEKAVRFLLGEGAEIDAASDTGDTAIGNAVRRGNTSIVRILLAAGAKTTNALPRSQTLIALARDRGHDDLVKLLSN
jgi:hypothetical protein